MISMEDREKMENIIHSIMKEGKVENIKKLIDTDDFDNYAKVIKNEDLLKKELVKYSEEDIDLLKENLKKEYTKLIAERNKDLNSGIINEFNHNHRDFPSVVNLMHNEFLLKIREAKREESYSIIDIVRKKIDNNYDKENSIEKNIHLAIKGEESFVMILSSMKNSPKEFDKAIKNLNSKEFEDFQEKVIEECDKTYKTYKEEYIKMLGYSAYIREEGLIQTIQDYIAFSGSDIDDVIESKAEIGNKVLRKRKNT